MRVRPLFSCQRTLILEYADVLETRVLLQIRNARPPHPQHSINLFVVELRHPPVVLRSLHHDFVGAERHHLVVHAFSDTPGLPLNVIERLRVRQHTHLPCPFRRPRHNRTQLLKLGRLQRAFLRRIAANFFLSQNDPALSDGIFAKFHSMSLAGVTCRCRSLFEAVAIPNRAFAREVGHFEILR